MKKLVLITGIGVVILILVAVIVIGLNLGSLVKIGIEQMGLKITQVSTNVDSVNVSLLTGSASIKGFVLGNPQGFTTSQAIKVGDIAVSLDPTSVMSGKIVIHSVKVESPEITFEEVFLNGNNLNKILNNVRASNNVPSNSNTTVTSNNKPAPKLEVDDFLISGAIVHVSLSNVTSKDIPLPVIHLTDLGKGGDGLTPAQLTGAVLNAILSDTLKAVASSALTKSSGNNLGDQVTNVLGSLLGK